MVILGVKSVFHFAWTGVGGQEGEGAVVGLKGRGEELRPQHMSVRFHGKLPNFIVEMTYRRSHMAAGDNS